MKRIEPIVFSKSSGNPIFGQIFGHQRAKNEVRNTKMYRGQETHPVRVNARYEMDWANSFFHKVPETPFSAKYLATRGPKKEAMNTKMYRGQETHPIRINARYEMNWANSFFKKFRKPCLQTDRRTDRQTWGWIQYTPFHLWWRGGHNNQCIDWMTGWFDSSISDQTIHNKTSWMKS